MIRIKKKLTPTLQKKEVAQQCNIDGFVRVWKSGALKKPVVYHMCPYKNVGPYFVGIFPEI